MIPVLSYGQVYMVFEKKKEFAQSIVHLLKGIHLLTLPVQPGQNWTYDHRILFLRKKNQSNELQVTCLYVSDKLC